MSKIFLLILCFSIFVQIPVNAYSNEREVLKDLTLIEEKIFYKAYKKENIEQRLERLEIAVYGAIQDGCEYIRIKKMKHDITSISAGGNGLATNNKVYNLAGNNSYNYNWSVGNIKHFNNTHYNMDRYSHRLPAPYGHHHSHRLPPPPCNNRNPIDLGNVIQNYSWGTKIKILDD